ncbi:hypothetical protein ACSSS7_003452 [Eimeria intestinalis]
MEAKTEPQGTGESQQSQQPVTAVTPTTAEAPHPASVESGSSASQQATKQGDDPAIAFAVKSETPAADEKQNVTSPASSLPPSQTQIKADGSNPAADAASAPPSQVKEGGGPPPPPAAAGQGAPGTQVALLDEKEVALKLERLFDCWGGRGPNAATQVWADVEALCVFVGRAAEEDDSAAERMQSWLTGFQFLETLFVFVRATKAWLILTSAKKADHLRQLDSIKGLQIFVKEPHGSNQRSLEQIAAALKNAVGKESERDIRIAPFLGGSLAETPGTMAAEVLPWMKNFTQKEENVEVPLSPLMATLVPGEVALVADASRVSVAMVKHQLVSRVEFVLDNGQKESHKSICDRAELLLKDQKQLQKLKEKYNLDPAEVEVLYKNVQSGSRFDLRASAQPTADPLSQTEGTIEHKSTYELALELQQHLIASLKPGVSFSSIYEKAIEFLNTKRPALLKHLAKNVGHAIGAQYRDARLVFNQKNDKVFTEPGMTFLVSVGFSDLRTTSGNDYAVWIADTVHLKADGTVQVLTDGLSSQLAYVNYELDDGEEEEQKPAAPSKAKSSKDERRESKKGIDENADGNAADKKKGKEKVKDKKEKDTEKPDKQFTGTISASVLKNAESLILRDRLRRRDNGSAAHMEAAEERDNRQRELRKKKLNALQQV